jgi:hypothetical protein
VPSLVFPVFVGTVSPVGGPSGLPAVPGLLGRPGLGGQRASGGLGSLGLQEAGDTPTLLAVGVLCGPMGIGCGGEGRAESRGACLGSTCGTAWRVTGLEGV